MLTREQLGQAASEAGADVFGVANVERFDGLPPDKHPRSIFPECRSVVVLGRRIPRGALRGVEEGTNFQDFVLYGCDWLDNRFCALTTFRTSEFLEDHGYEAVPLPNLPPEVPPMGVAVRAGAVAPNVMLDFTDAAVRAGVGEIGRCGWLLTPRFGPRQRVQMILTDAAVEPSPLPTQAICPGESECAGGCPLEAITGRQVDYRQCATCQNGAMPNRYHATGKPERLAAACARACVDFLERTGRVGNKFAAPFRQREPWSVRSQADLFKL